MLYLTVGGGRPSALPQCFFGGGHRDVSRTKIVSDRYIIGCCYVALYFSITMFSWIKVAGNSSELKVWNQWQGRLARGPGQYFIPHLWPVQSQKLPTVGALPYGNPLAQCLLSSIGCPVVSFPEPIKKRYKKIYRCHTVGRYEKSEIIPYKQTNSFHDRKTEEESTVLYKAVLNPHPLLSPLTVA